MNPRKAAGGLAVSLALVAGVGVAGACFATDYQPTLLGNEDYANRVDARNDYGIEGIYYTSKIADQNADTVADARSLSTAIGTETDDTSPIIVTNSLGSAVKEFTYRSSADSGFPSNMLSATLADGESLCWNYAYEYEEETRTSESGDEWSMPVNYTLQAVLEDGTVAEFHDVNLNGVRTINLCYSEDYGVYYVERTTITNHTPDPNLYYEVNHAAADDQELLNFHVNSAARLGDLAWTSTRGKAWNLEHDVTQTVVDYGIELPLYGTPEGDYTDGLYDELHWNSDTLVWREYNND